MPSPVTARAIQTEAAMRTVPTTAMMAITLALTGAISVPASAQAPAPTPAPTQRQDLPPMRERQELPTAPKLNLTLEQRHTIREFIKDLKPQEAADNVQAGVGDAVPQGVNLQPMPADVGRKVPQVKSHRFFVAGHQIVLVDPSSNKVADVIKLQED
jgi:hypothetical protein